MKVNKQMKHLEYYVVYYLSRGKLNPPIRVSTINFLTRSEAEQKVQRLKETEPNLVKEPEIYEYRY